jgi:hypothetical protein
MRSIRSKDGWTYYQEMVKCGKSTCKCTKGELHGPYWFRTKSENGRTKRKYVGKVLPSPLAEEAAHKTHLRTAVSQLCPECDRPLGTDLTNLEGMGGFLYHKACIAKVAAKILLERFDQGEEPLSGELAETLGIDAAVMGRLLPQYGIPKPANTTRKRGGEKVVGKFYTNKMRDEVAAVLK